MTIDRHLLLVRLNEYADESYGVDEGTDILSAIVNTIDSILEGKRPECVNGLQVDREKAIVEFILSHRN